MAQTEDEKELVLGNKQLMSLFFVVVLLCALFFALGYMIGRPRQAIASLDGNAASAASDVPRSPDSEPPRETAATQARQRGANNAAGGNAAETPQLPVQTQPARDVPAQALPASTGIAVPEPGATYLQVTALHRADADNLVKTLREQNFPALLAESSKADLFRVLVGPYHQTSQVAEAKDRLKSLGFGNAFVQK